MTTTKLLHTICSFLNHELQDRLDSEIMKDLTHIQIYRTIARNVLHYRGWRARSLVPPQFGLHLVSAAPLSSLPGPILLSTWGQLKFCFYCCQFINKSSAVRLLSRGINLTYKIHLQRQTTSEHRSESLRGSLCKYV